VFTGWIIDAKPRNRGGITLLITDGRTRIETSRPAARFNLYLKPKLPALIPHLLNHPDLDPNTGMGGDGEGGVEEEWWMPPWYTEKTSVARLPFTSLEALSSLERRLTAEGAAEVYNTYPDRITQLFWSLNYPPTAKVECAGDGQLTPAENPSAEDYEQPGYSWAELRFYDWYGETLLYRGKSPMHFDLEVHTRDEHYTVRREELSALGAYARGVSGVDVLGYPKTYTQILVEAGLNPYRVPLTLDRRTPTSEGVREALIRLVEWSRISYTPLRLLAHASIGKPLTANEAHVAYERKWLITQTNTRLEDWKTIPQLVEHDRGGLLYRPKPGAHFNVVQLDFTSMYPTLIHKWNISPETVNNPHAQHTQSVPRTKHTVDTGRLGVVPEALSRLLTRRERLRQLAVELGDRALELRQQAVKWLLVASFGYLGFRNAKFGKIEAYECVTALARETVRRAVDAVEGAGYRVLHVMVDSVFIQRWDGAPIGEDELNTLIHTLEQATGLKLKVEAKYDWVVFSRNRHSTLASPQRYYGRLASGALKLKGLECVKRSCPQIIRDAQLEALSILGEARTPEEFAAALRHAQEAFKKHRGKIELACHPNAETPPHLFTFCVQGAKRAVRGGVEGYMWLLKGVEGYYPAEWGYMGIDREHYLKLLDAAWEQLDPQQPPQQFRGEGG
jgi:DNA polymerase elongation subunit (family B)